MPLNNYGVLKGRAIVRRLGSGSSPHYQIDIVDEVGIGTRLNGSGLSELKLRWVCPRRRLFFVADSLVYFRMPRRGQGM